MLLRFDPRPTSPLATSSRLPFDAVQKDHEVELRFDVPGVDPTAIDISVDHRMLTVATERTHQATAEGEHVLAAGRSHGRQVRRLTLSDTVDTAGITAQVDQGVLTLHLPVAEAAKPRRIEVGTPTPVEVTTASTSEAATSEAASDEVAA